MTTALFNTLMALWLLFIGLHLYEPDGDGFDSVALVIFDFFRIALWVVAVIYAMVVTLNDPNASP